MCVLTKNAPRESERSNKRRREGGVYGGGGERFRLLQRRGGCDVAGALRGVRHIPLRRARLTIVVVNLLGTNVRFAKD